MNKKERLMELDKREQELNALIANSEKELKEIHAEKAGLSEELQKAK